MSPTNNPTSISATITPVFLSSIRNHPNLPPYAWQIITAVILSILGRTNEPPIVFAHAINIGPGIYPSTPSPSE